MERISSSVLLWPSSKSGLWKNCCRFTQRVCFFCYQGLAVLLSRRQLLSPCEPRVCHRGSPEGTIVQALPWGSQIVVLNGITYYIYNGVYYVSTPRGYVVVPQPLAATTVVPATVTIVQMPSTATLPNSESTSNVFTINIPNTKGGYTAVILKKSGNGFVGPQGEFYPEFPSVEQLKIMYATKVA